MTFSKVRTTSRTNGSFGFDHGVAAPTFLIGGPAHGGLHGAYPSLTNLTPLT
jgi:uncharacterized protein (DUF1501 family)